ncbi:MAG: hypothetical protein ACI8ZB_003236 [Desulforhopalus sp.]|jgi:hypothetical protein
MEKREIFLQIGRGMLGSGFGLFELCEVACGVGVVVLGLVNKLIQIYMPLMGSIK